MQTIKINVADAICPKCEAAMLPEAQQAVATLLSGNGAGNDFLGWVKLPTDTTDTLIDDINATARRLRNLCEVIVAVGIGGSYLGRQSRHRSPLGLVQLA